jgi:outer membrane autotransporter protein
LIGSYVHNVYTQQRVISFLGQTANSDPNGNEGIANLDGGYEFHQGALKFGPLAGLQYTHLEVDGYNEGGSIADLSVQSQAANSLRSRFGGDVSYAFRDAGISIIPRFSAAYQHDFMDQGRGITSSFNAGGGDFIVQTPHPSRDSALLDLGVDADFTQRFSVFADYLVEAGQSNYFGQSIQAGVKFGF